MKPKYIATAEQRGFDGSLAELNDNGVYVVIATGLWAHMEDLAKRLNEVEDAEAVLDMAAGR